MISLSTGPIWQLMANSEKLGEAIPGRFHPIEASFTDTDLVLTVTKSGSHVDTVWAITRGLCDLWASEVFADSDVNLTVTCGPVTATTTPELLLLASLDQLTQQAWRRQARFAIGS